MGSLFYTVCRVGHEVYTWDGEKLHITERHSAATKTYSAQQTHRLLNYLYDHHKDIIEASREMQTIGDKPGQKKIRK